MRAGHTRDTNTQIIGEAPGRNCLQDGGFTNMLIWAFTKIFAQCLPEPNIFTIFMSKKLHKTSSKLCGMTEGNKDKVYFFTMFRPATRKCKVYLLEYLWEEIYMNLTSIVIVFKEPSIFSINKLHCLRARCLKITRPLHFSRCAPETDAVSASDSRARLPRAPRTAVNVKALEPRLAHACYFPSGITLHLTSSADQNEPETRFYSLFDITH